MPRTAPLTRQEEYQALRRLIKMYATERRGSPRLTELMERELTPRQYELMVLYYVEQRGMYDIARDTGVTVSTVSRTLSRARRRLRKALRYGGDWILGDDADLIC